MLPASEARAFVQAVSKSLEMLNTFLLYLDGSVKNRVLSYWSASASYYSEDVCHASSRDTDSRGVHNTQPTCPLKICVTKEGGAH